MNAINYNEGEIIKKIKNLDGEYDPESNLSLQDQLLICESVAESRPVLPGDTDSQILQETKTNTSKTNEFSVSGENGGYRRNVNSTLTQSKHKIIAKLHACGYRTSPIVVASLLEQLFRDSDTKEGHWLFIAQHWAPRPINRVISSMIKRHQRGEATIHNPAAYFTFLIKKRKWRRGL